MQGKSKTLFVALVDLASVFFCSGSKGDLDCFLQEIVPFSPFLSVGPIQEMPILSRLSRIGPRIKWCLKQCPSFKVQTVLIQNVKAGELLHTSFHINLRIKF